MRKLFVLLGLTAILATTFPPPHTADATGAVTAVSDAVVRDAGLFAKQYAIDDSLALLIVRAADRYRIPRQTAFRLIYTESRFKVEATSPTNAIGLAQVLHSTARHYDADITRRELYDPGTNLDLGFRFLAQMRQRYRGDMWLALVAYNAGPRVADSLQQQFRYAHVISRP